MFRSCFSSWETRLEVLFTLAFKLFILIINCWFCLKTKMSAIFYLQKATLWASCRDFAPLTPWQIVVFHCWCRQHTFHTIIFLIKTRLIRIFSYFSRCCSDSENHVIICGNVEIEALNQIFNFTQAHYEAKWGQVEYSNGYEFELFGFWMRQEQC